tara:strand:+ start:1711 stop:3279 length:1569 start_codon:yes stop_codon:yes gene_type:complete
MNSLFEKRLKLISDSGREDILCNGIKGIEKESLRINLNGEIAQSDHPKNLGSALTNKFITTDFSEALLEFVTPAYKDTWGVMSLLCDIHKFTYENLDNELLWVASMPCALGQDDIIPIAKYGSSNVGRMKSVYRKGLSLRYGSNMQAISGIHFNFSLPDEFWPIYKLNEQNEESLDDFRSSQYMAMIRNFKRNGWLILYLFGASPAICKSFLSNIKTSMPSLDNKTIYQPYATSLRMSDLGYTSTVQSNINISVNNLHEYTNDLNNAISTPEPTYSKFGLLDNEEYQQLSLNKLQIENEYYSPVRPKRVAQSGERPTSALDRGGIEYIEVRSLDLNVFDPVGINQETMRFIEAFLIYCMLEKSEFINKTDDQELTKNHTNTATHGRANNLSLKKNGVSISLKSWAELILEGTLKVANLLDKGMNCSAYTDSVKKQMKLINDADKTPSAMLLNELQHEGVSFAEYGLNLANERKEYFSNIMRLSHDRQALFEKEAENSLKKQKSIETQDQLPFDEYLKNYFSS